MPLAGDRHHSAQPALSHPARNRPESREIEEIVEPRSEIVEKTDSLKPTAKRDFGEWDVGAPLEVIYEEGGEGDDGGPPPNSNLGDAIDGRNGEEGNQAGWRGTLLCQCITPETNSDCLSDGGGEGFSTTGGWDLAAKGEGSSGKRRTEKSC
ncbi:unnamed protein product [Linum tenue]|uniref:Uncharacterized protein n=1 Tax=Linum tenue TaxID=586396 RepID=A0AAV0K1E3_9ROSI|nr:unnamed protein product [Linum tenue]